ncbi:MAG: ribonuclease P protein component [Muribaculaceae bacterium]|nr:ribonuclease P protein component [Muribaculaceae bacterium]
MKTFGLYKKQKLCSTCAIEQLFSAGGADFSRLVYPLRIVARRNPRRSSDAPIAFLISIPKKRLRHAVDRVLMRRRTREAFRLNHHDFPLPEGEKVDVALVYVANGLTPYPAVENAVKRLLKGLSEHFSTTVAEDSPQ